MRKSLRLLISATVASLAAWFFWALPFAPDEAATAIQDGSLSLILTAFVWLLFFVTTLRIIVLIELDRYNY